MKQIVRVGNAIAIRDVPIPHASPGFIVVRNSYSLISTGTETRSLRNSSALVKGITTISRKIFAPQKAYANLGYTCAGVIEEIGEGVHGFALGDRVLCVGFDYAVHAEIVKVPAPLVFHLPQTISFTHAPFAALGSVALHALRRSNIAFGEKALVIGLGLTGQLLVRLLLLNGCSVIGVDPNDYKITLAQKAGGEYIKGKRDFAQTVLDKTGHGVDVAFVCTDMHDNENLEEIMTTIRDRGKLVAVANITCSLPFPLFFRKELDLIVSRSFGPGRFDKEYEEKGIDYPLGYVRWTERRNIEEVLRLLGEQKLVVDPLISAEYPIQHAQQAYHSLLGRTRPVALLLKYS